MDKGSNGDTRPLAPEPLATMETASVSPVAPDSAATPRSARRPEAPKDPESYETTDAVTVAVLALAGFRPESWQRLTDRNKAVERQYRGTPGLWKAVRELDGGKARVEPRAFMGALSEAEREAR